MYTNESASLESSDQPLITVIDINRFTIDPVFKSQTALVGHHSNDAYDLTVSDGLHKCKLVLSCDFNHLIQKRKICIGSKLKLRKVKVRYDERNLHGSVIPVLMDLLVVTEDIVKDVSALASVPWHPGTKTDQQEPKPLASSRAYYLDLWSNTSIEKSVDTTEVTIHNNLEDVTDSDLYSVKEVACGWQTLRVVKPRLLLRVICRGRLIHYARPDKVDKWPFQLRLVVGDQTGCCAAIFWNAMGPRYISHLQEGSVIMLRNFIVKPQFKTLVHHILPPPSLPWYEIDINVNSHNPQGEVTLLDPAVLRQMDKVDLPVPVGNFLVRRQLSAIPDNFICDVVGMVTFVGIIQREKMNVKQGIDSGGFWFKRWVHIQDNSSRIPIVIQLYRGTEKKIFEEDLAIGQLLVCRNMRVVHGLNHLQSSRQLRHVFITSTADTQIYIQDPKHKRVFPFSEDTSLQSVLKWAKNARLDVTRWGKLLEIFFFFPPMPTSLTTFSQLTEQVEVQITPSDSWKSFVEKMSYLESAQILIQAKLSSVCFYKKSSSVRSKISKRTTISQEKILVSGSEHDESIEQLGYLPLQHVTEPLPGTAATSDSAIQEHEIEEGFEDFFVLQWQGLNTDILLNSVKPCYLCSSPPDLTLLSFLSGLHDVLPWETTVRMNKYVVDKILKSASSEVLCHQRFLVMLSMFCLDGELVMVYVNRAFPVM